MFGIIEKIFIVLLTTIVNGSSHILIIYMLMNTVKNYITIYLLLS